MGCSNIVKWCNWQARCRTPFCSEHRNSFTSTTLLLRIPFLFLSLCLQQSWSVFCLSLDVWTICIHIFKIFRASANGYTLTAIHDAFERFRQQQQLRTCESPTGFEHLLLLRSRCNQVVGAYLTNALRFQVKISVHVHCFVPSLLWTNDFSSFTDTPVPLKGQNLLDESIFHISVDDRLFVLFCCYNFSLVLTGQNQKSSPYFGSPSCFVLHLTPHFAKFAAGVSDRMYINLTQQAMALGGGKVRCFHQQRVWPMCLKYIVPLHRDFDSWILDMWFRLFLNFSWHCRRMRCTSMPIYRKDWRAQAKLTTTLLFFELFLLPALPLPRTRRRNRTMMMTTMTMMPTTKFCLILSKSALWLFLLREFFFLFLWNSFKPNFICVNQASPLFQPSFCEILSTRTQYRFHQSNIFSGTEYCSMQIFSFSHMTTNDN